MTATDGMPDDSRYARCIESSKRVRWGIDKDVIRGRHFDVAHEFLPDGARHPHFGKALSGLVTESQGQRIQAALATLH